MRENMGDIVNLRRVRKERAVAARTNLPASEQNPGVAVPGATRPNARGRWK
jgi:hypothetical protein